MAPRLIAVRDREDSTPWDTWTPWTWFTIAPGVKVLSSFAYRACGNDPLFIAYLRAWGRDEHMEISNGRRFLVETVTNHHDIRPRPGIGGLLEQNTHQTVRRTALTRQGVRDLDRADGRGYNGNRASCPHKTPGVISTYSLDERITVVEPDLSKRVVYARATYCSGCDARLWDDRRKN